MAAICACLRSRDGIIGGWVDPANLASLSTSLQEKLHLGSRAEDVDLDNQSVIAPIDDGAARKVLENRGLLDDLQTAWTHGGGSASDMSWFERLVCGKVWLNQGQGGFLDSKEPYLGFLLCSDPVCDGRSRASISERSAVQGKFWWPQWHASRPKLDVNRLHLLPAEGTSTTAALSFDLGDLMRPPTTTEKETGEVTITIDLGIKVVELVVLGPKPATRWAAAVKLGLMNSLAEAAEMEGPALLEELEAFDYLAEEARIGNALREQQAIFKDLATAIDYEGTSVHMEDGLDVPTMATKLVSCPSLKIERFTEALKRVAGLPRTLLTAAVRSEPPRMDVLDFWRRWYHKPWCRALEVLWDARSMSMSPSDLLNIAKLLGVYDKLLEMQLLIDDSSLDTSLSDVAEVYGRRSFANLGDLAEDVAALSVPEKMEDRTEVDGPGNLRWATSSPVDLLVFVGPTCEVALDSRPELAERAIDIIDGVLLRFQKALVDRLHKERQQNSLAPYRELLAAFIDDAECFAFNCARLAVVASADSTAQSKFKACQDRFILAKQGFCESLVTVAFHTAGVVQTYGLPLSPEAVTSVDLKTLLHDNVTLVVTTIQETLGRSARQDFAFRFLVRMVALELHAVMQPTSSPVPPEKLAAKLREHKGLLTEAATTWLGQDQAATIAKRVQTLEEVATLLLADTSAIAKAADEMRTSYGEAFNSAIVKSLLSCRSVPESARDAAMAATRRASAKPSKPVNFLPACEAACLALGGSVFHWAAEPLWIEQANSFGKISAGDEEEDMEKEDSMDLDEFLGAEGAAEDEDEDLDLEAFLGGETQSDGGLAASGETTPMQQARLRARKSRRSSAQRMANAAAAAAVASAVESPSAEQDAAENIRGYLYVYDAVMAAGDSSSSSFGGRLISVTKRAVNTAKVKLAADWRQAFFVVKKNARMQRILTWYSKVGDKIPKGSLRLADVVTVEATETLEPTLPYCVSLSCERNRDKGGDVEQKVTVVNLRTQKKQDCDMWVQALTKLIAREGVRGGSKAFVARDGAVLTLRGTLLLPDPDHYQAAFDEQQQPPPSPKKI